MSLSAEDRNLLKQFGAEFNSYGIDVIALECSEGNLSALLTACRNEGRETAAANTIGAAELAVGQFVYRRIEKLMDAKGGTAEGAELSYLADIACSVEEYAALGDEDGSPSPQFAEAAEGFATVKALLVNALERSLAAEARVKALEARVAALEPYEPPPLRKGACEVCRGSGCEPGDEQYDCGACGGSGKAKRVRKSKAASLLQGDQAK